MTYLQAKAFDIILALNQQTQNILDRRQDMHMLDPDGKQIAKLLSDQEDWLLALREEEKNNFETE